MIRLPNIKQAKEKEGLELCTDPKAPVTASIKIHCYLHPSEPWKNSLQFAALAICGTIWHLELKCAFT